MRWENIGIKILIGYVIGTFVIMEILYFGVWCRPFHEYWAVPTNSSQCDAATNHLITNAVFNLSSDCIMLAIGLPMFLRMKLPWSVTTDVTPLKPQLMLTVNLQEEEVASCCNLLARGIRHSRSDPEQGIFIQPAIRCTVDVLVRARKLNSALGRQSAFCLESE